MTRLELFKNLMVMAAADGKVTEEEVQFLSGRSTRWGLSDEEFEEALDYADQPDAELTLPNGREERAEMLQELIRMMAVDGELAEIEKNLFAVAAAAMGFGNNELNALLDKML